MFHWKQHGLVLLCLILEWIFQCLLTVAYWFTKCILWISLNICYRFSSPSPLRDEIEKEKQLEVLSDTVGRLAVFHDSTLTWVKCYDKNIRVRDHISSICECFGPFYLWNSSAELRSPPCWQFCTGLFSLLICCELISDLKENSKKCWLCTEIRTLLKSISMFLLSYWTFWRPKHFA